MPGTSLARVVSATAELAIPQPRARSSCVSPGSRVWRRTPVSDIESRRHPNAAARLPRVRSEVHIARVPRALTGFRPRSPALGHATRVPSEDEAMRGPARADDSLYWAGVNGREPSAELVRATQLSRYGAAQPTLRA